MVNIQNITIIFLFIIICGFIYIQSQKKVIKIGFVGALTAKYSVLGNAMMNGVILAFEEVDYKIGNTKVELIFKDDKKDEDVNRAIINNFIQNDVKIVIGNVTSSMSKISMSIINKHKDMFMISAASASNEFSKKDDQFFRTHVANNAQRFDSFTSYIKKNNFNRIYGLYDSENITYTKDYLINFEKSFLSNGGKNFIAFKEIPIDLDLIIEDIKNKKPDLLLISANSIDTAKLVQYVRLKNLDIQIASSEWARTPSFIENSGKSSEGVIFNIDYDENSNNPKYLEFVKKYKAKYNMPPSMFSLKAYELAQVIIESLNNVDETKVKQYVLEKKKFEGLQGDIIFDEYGDVIREFYTFKVKNGKFIKVE